MARDAHRHFPKGGFLPTAKGGLMGESEEVPKGGLMWERARSEEVRSQCLNLNFCALGAGRTKCRRHSELGPILPTFLQEMWRFPAPAT